VKRDRGRRLYGSTKVREEGEGWERGGEGKGICKPPNLQVELRYTYRPKNKCQTRQSNVIVLQEVDIGS